MNYAMTRGQFAEIFPSEKKIYRNCGVDPLRPPKKGISKFTFHLRIDK